MDFLFKLWSSLFSFGLGNGLKIRICHAFFFQTVAGCLIAIVQRAGESNETLLFALPSLSSLTYCIVENFAQFFFAKKLKRKKVEEKVERKM